MLRYLKQLGKQRPFPYPFYDFFGFLYYEAQCYQRDDPVTWPEVGGIHPFAPSAQNRRLQTIIS